MYFKRFPKIKYDFPQLEGLEVQDIFRRVQFTEKTLNDDKNFESYVVKEGQTPDKVAEMFYGDPNFWWLVLFCNNIIDIENEWPRSVRELDKLFSSFLTGNSYYLMEHLDAREGDIIVKRDTVCSSYDEDDSSTHGCTCGINIDVYGIVDNYDPLLRKIDVKVGSGTLNKGDEVHIFRKGVTGEYTSIKGFGETGCYQPFFGSTSCVGISGPESNDAHTHWAPLHATQGSTFGIIQKKDSIRDSVVKFQYLGNDINPYSSYLVNVEGQNNGPSGDFFSYQSLAGLTGTILYDYITDNINYDLSPVSKFADILNTNDRNRTIKLLVPRLAGLMIDQVGYLISGNYPPGQSTLVELSS